MRLAHGDVLLDPENIFFHPGTGDNGLRRSPHGFDDRLLIGMLHWFESSATARVRQLRSYGVDRRTAELDEYLRQDGRFEVHEVPIGAASPPFGFPVDPERIRAVSVRVAEGKNKADQRLVSELAVAVADGSASDRILLASGDFGVIEAAAVHQTGDPRRLWLVLSHGARSAEERLRASLPFPDGTWAHAAEVRHIGYAYWRRRVGTAEWARKRAAERALREQEELAGDPGRGFDAKLEALLAIEWRAIVGTVPGTVRWDAALGTSTWLRDAVAARFEACGSPRALEAVRSGAGHDEQSYRTVIGCAAVAELLDEPDGRRRLLEAIAVTPRLRFLKQPLATVLARRLP